MENLMFCLNATGPIFLMMVFGLFLRKVGILDEDFANRMNKMQRARYFLRKTV